ncbi:MAG: hypothetical protein LLF89_10270 [Spirochaetaceae bacterium]|nr:hypothetical protein [Spirochaetaceae bacterium]
MEKQGPESRFDTALSIVTLLLIYSVLLSRFDLSLLFSDTILTGGDSASWYQVLSTLKNDFLPHGRLFAFSQGNFFGYMEGQHYFVLPFLFAALLGFFMPLTVALKITTMLGGFALPLTVFAGVVSITGSKRSASVAAAASLLFLFNESYSIFGGNWLSTFAGEFCYSWAIAFLPLLIASIIRDIREKRSGVASGILLGLIGLSHLFVFMPAFFLPFFPAFGTLPELFGRKENGKGQRPGQGQGSPTTTRILVTYVCAFLMMAFWLLPMAASRQWAQPISILWNFSSLKAFASQTDAPVWIAAIILFIITAFSHRQEGYQRMLAAFFAYALGACAFLFFIAPGLGMPDIRFIPTALMICVVGLPSIYENLPALFGRKAGATGSQAGRPGTPSVVGSRWGQSGKARDPANNKLRCFLAFFLVMILCWVSARSAKNSPAWYVWNYSGYETKSEWPVMQELAERYKGTTDSGRFLWEKQDQHDNADFGSERAFENLPLFTGRPTSEGIHYGSSMMARAATYLQSSYSLNPVDPEAERIYSAIDPESWPARFSLLNAHYIITHSSEITERFRNSPAFALDSSIGKFSIFRFVDFRKSYVEILPSSSIHLVGEGVGGFKTDYYRFFREYELYGEPFVSSAFADQDLRKVLPGYSIHDSYDSYRSQVLPQVALGLRHANQPAVRNEHVDNFTISFDTDKPGQPHYIKISYAPGWKSAQGEKIYPASPGFMLIIPRTSHVELNYGRIPSEKIGAILSMFFLPFAIAVGVVQGRRRRKNVSGKGKDKAGKGRSWKILMGLAMVIFVVTALILTIQTERGYPALARDIGKARSLRLASPQERRQAKKLVEKWAVPETLERYDNMLGFDAFRIKAWILQSEGKISEAREIIDMLKRRYPHTRAVLDLPVL